jgi:hypothetical protein
MMDFELRNPTPENDSLIVRQAKELAELIESWRKHQLVTDGMIYDSVLKKMIVVKKP